MNNPTNSQLAQQYVMNTYPCIQAWINFVNSAVPYTLQYDSVSCAQLSLISRIAMKVMDHITVMESNSSVIRVARMLADLQDIAWRCWTSFSAQSGVTRGSRSVSITPTALQGMSTMNSWDIVTNCVPSDFDPPTLFNTILSGVTV